VKRIDIEQGTPEWLEWRKGFKTGSNAPKALGDSPYQSRHAYMTELLNGTSKPIHKKTAEIFQKGHDSEAAARPIVEQILSQTEGRPITLAPACCEMEESDWPKEIPQPMRESLEGKMAASLDGLSEDGTIIFEHKLWNLKLNEAIEEGELPNHIVWQLEHNMLVTGAKQAIFVTSDGTSNKMALMIYEASLFTQAALIAGWYQLGVDLKEHQPIEVIDGKASEEWTVIENDLNEVDAHLSDLTEKKKQLREKAEEFCAGRKVEGSGWTGSPQKMKGSVNWAKAIKGEAPQINLEDYRSPDKEIFVLRRNKK
jgi:predicted phage-related endonuclease